MPELNFSLTPMELLFIGNLIVGAFILGIRLYFLFKGN